MDKKEMKNKYSIIIAITLIAVLVGAMICLGASKKNNDNNNDHNNNEISDSNNNIINEDINSGEEYLELEQLLRPELEGNIERDAEGNKVNVSPNIKDGMTFDFLELSNISLKYVDGTTQFSATAMNNSDDEYLLGVKLNVTFYDNKGYKIYETSILSNAIYAHKEMQIDFDVERDCSYADTFDIEIIKDEM